MLSKLEGEGEGGCNRVFFFQFLTFLVPILKKKKYLHSKKLDLTEHV